MRHITRPGVALLTCLILCVLASDVRAQGTYDESTGQEQIQPTQKRGWQGFPFGRRRQQQVEPAPAPTGTQQSPPVGVRYEENIPPTEQPGPRSAMTVPSARGGTTFGNRRINFPRDRGDDLDILKLQIFLDYHGYSVGEIDGKWGYNTERALFVYQKNNSLDQTGQLDNRMQARLNSFPEGFLMEYTLKADDLKGPFHEIPRDYYAQAKMKFLPYETAIEAIAEKFHCSQGLLRKLNPGVDFDRLQPGLKILALNVINGIDDKRGKVSLVRISKANKWIEAYDGDGQFMFYYPSTLGSEHDPLPIGRYSVTSVVQRPPFKYQPKLFWDANPNEPEAMIPPGPNSPCGVVWIGTSRRSVGIHGTPNPELISRNTSHGCIRMTNWDAVQLSKRVTGGTPLEFVP